jgi:SAM-dependent methyltransferase
VRREVIDRLIAVNRAMYEGSAEAFSATRAAPWPGWERLFARFRGPATVLDLGCGNGRFLAALEARGLVRSYTGVDTSEPLLEEARARFPRAAFVLSDVRTFGTAEPFDWVVAFGLLHHLPGRAERRAWMARLPSLGRSACVTFWRFADRARFERRMRPFSLAGIEAEDVEAGDYLLAFQETSLRYCHHAGDEEVEEMLEASGMQSIDRYEADGETGDLNLYAVLGTPDLLEGR